MDGDFATRQFYTLTKYHLIVEGEGGFQDDLIGPLEHCVKANESSENDPIQRISVYLNAA